MQQKDPHTFARQLGYVFAEARRVLKDGGVLAFSFHHSRAEGWAAIYEALATAGLCVVAAHPVHAELRAASPKTAAKAPISLDAILVCKKRPRPSEVFFDEPEILRATQRLVRQLEKAGMRISTGDRFVIAAAKTLIATGPELLGFDGIKERLEAVRVRLGQTATPEFSIAAEPLSQATQNPGPFSG